MINRSNREHLLHLLFWKQSEADPTETLKEDIDYYFSDFASILGETKTSSQSIMSILQNILANIENIDEAISKNLKKGWSINRLNKAELAILRLAAHEMLNEPEVPHSASINEAVELTKNYSAEESAKFVNGILGGLLRSIKNKNDEGENAHKNL